MERFLLDDYLAGYGSIEKPVSPIALLINEKTDTKRTFPLIQAALTIWVLIPRRLPLS